MNPLQFLDDDLPLSRRVGAIWAPIFGLGILVVGLAIGLGSHVPNVIFESVALAGVLIATAGALLWPAEKLLKGRERRYARKVAAAIGQPLRPDVMSPRLIAVLWFAGYLVTVVAVSRLLADFPGRLAAGALAEAQGEYATNARIGVTILFMLLGGVHVVVQVWRQKMVDSGVEPR